MDSVKLSYKSRNWVVKLHWQNGKLYMGRNWYSFASTGNLQSGDTIAFQKTKIPQKYAICVFEKDLLGKCNLAGVGQKNGIMDWFKIADLQFISTGEMEIPRVFTKLPGIRIPQIVNLLMRDGQTLIANYSPERNLLCGMTEMIQKYSIRATDVMIFSLTNDCIFVVSLFKISGMESKYIVAERDGAEAVANSGSEQIINNADASNEELEGVELENGPDAAVNAEVDNGGMPIQPINFRVTLKPSHVDKRQHGVYVPHLSVVECFNHDKVNMWCYNFNGFSITFWESMQAWEGLVRVHSVEQTLGRPSPPAHLCRQPDFSSHHCAVDDNFCILKELLAVIKLCEFAQTLLILFETFDS